MNLPQIKEEVWYKNGLKFQCTGCGKCCTGAPGYVWIEEEEGKAIADFLKLSLEEFSKFYLRKVDGRLSLKEWGSSHDCIFLEEKKVCRIYPVRPKQCRTFPFWREILIDESSWEKTAQRCEGIRNDAPLISREDIQTHLESAEKID